MMKRASSTLYEQMNKWASARAHHYESQNQEPRAAAQLAIDESVQHFGLMLITSWGECEIYRSQDGDFLNCWRESPYSELIEEGGVGFDDSIEWYEDVLNRRGV